MKLYLGVPVAPHDPRPVDVSADPRAAADAVWTLADVLDVVDHLPAMVAFWDSDLRNRFANSAYIEWFGHTPEQMRGMHIRDLLGPRVYELNREYIEQALAGKPQLFERTLVDTSGQTRHTQASYIPNVVDGNPQGFFVLVTDITQRVVAEDELRVSQQELGRAHERARIADDLHDVVIQQLYSLGLGLQAILAKEPDLSDRLEFLAEGLDDAVAELRASIRELKQEARAEDLEGWLEHRARDIERILGFSPTVTYAGQIHTMPPQLLRDVLAVLNEALSNTTRHAGASSIGVTVDVSANSVQLIVSDDGRGMSVPGRSSGLANMRRRAERYGGTFSVEPNSPRGTVLRWRAPFPVAIPKVSRVPGPRAEGP